MLELKIYLINIEPTSLRNVTGNFKTIDVSKLFSSKGIPLSDSKEMLLQFKNEGRLLLEFPETAAANLLRSALGQHSVPFDKHIETLLQALSMCQNLLCESEVQVIRLSAQNPADPQVK